ncbi:MAG: DUF6270 domain-containing protein [Actinomycetota bacterium]|nr:DUF6270 domain-containing protein [Actinomycetota bacterium]
MPSSATQERVRRLTDEAALLEHAAAMFAERVTVVLRPERVIVHRARWLTRFRDGGAVHAFPADRVDFAEHHNAALDRGYDALEHHLGGRAPVIALDDGRYPADAEHRWALEPLPLRAGLQRRGAGAAARPDQPVTTSRKLHSRTP